MKQRISTYMVLIVLAACSTIICSLIFTYRLTAHANSDCKPIEAIYARGSGEMVSKSDNMKSFRDSLRMYFDDTTLNLYELGTEKYGGSQYPAVNVADVSNGNAIGAWASSGYGNDYGKSINQGINELINYITQRSTQCPSSYFVLGGYSQGAQVVGQALSYMLREVRDRIAFVGLFGDPKLNLPEGVGWNPPACRNQNLSPWRRVIANCDVDNGSLGARAPYLPSDMEDKTGLWCYAHDFVCGSTKLLWDTDGHGQYGNPGAAIDNAVKEAANRLKSRLTEAQTEHIKAIDLSRPITDHDYLFVIDPGDLDQDAIDALTLRVSFLAEGITGLGGRVALAEAYMPTQDSPGYRVLSAFHDTAQNFKQGLGAITPIDSSQVDAAVQMQQAISGSMHDANWQFNSTKSLIYITGGRVNRSYNQVDYEYDTTIKNTVNQAKASGNVSISAFASLFAEDGMLGVVVDETHGQYVNITPDITLGLKKSKGVRLASQRTSDPLVDQFIQNELATPRPKFAIDAYYGEPGDMMNFDVAYSVADRTDIVRYEWDFDDDGSIDRTTTAPQTEYAYGEKFDGYASVKVTTSDGHSGSTAVKVQVGIRQRPVIPDSPSALKIETISTTGTMSKIMVTWNPPTNLPDHYLLRVNGFQLGTLTNDRTSVGLTDIDRIMDNEISITGIAPDGTEGVATAQVLKAGIGTDGKSFTSSASDTTKNDGARMLDDINDEVTSNSNKNVANELKNSANNRRKVLLWTSIGVATAVAGSIVGAVLYKRYKKG